MHLQSSTSQRAFPLGRISFMMLFKAFCTCACDYVRHRWTRNCASPPRFCSFPCFDWQSKTSKSGRGGQNDKWLNVIVLFLCRVWFSPTSQMLSGEGIYVYWTTLVLQFSHPVLQETPAVIPTSCSPVSCSCSSPLSVRHLTQNVSKNLDLCPASSPVQMRPFVPANRSRCERGVACTFRV